jgi:putative endonuclease
VRVVFPQEPPKRPTRPSPPTRDPDPSPTRDPDPSPTRDPDPSPGRDPSPSRDPDPRRALGRLGEELAAAHLVRLSFSIVARNVRTRAGEIDLIAFDGVTLVFAEVKTRRISARDQRVRTDQEPLPWLRPRQRARLRRLAVAWLSEHKHLRPTAHTIRFDAIGVIVNGQGRLLRLDHLEGAW